MANHLETSPPAATPGATKNNFRNSGLRIPKLPPFGNALADRQSWQNFPYLVVICVGRNAWQDAKLWEKSDTVALVLPRDELPGNFTWPVRGCTCLIDWSSGPGVAIVIALVRVLIKAGAKTVTVFPSFVDISKPISVYDPDKPIDERFVQLRQTVRSYYREQS